MDLNEKSKLKSGLLSLISELKRQKRNRLEINQGKHPEPRKYLKVMSSKDVKKRDDESKSKPKINTEYLKRALNG